MRLPAGRRPDPSHCTTVSRPRPVISRLHSLPHARARWWSRNPREGVRTAHDVSRSDSAHGLTRRGPYRTYIRVLGRCRPAWVHGLFYRFYQVRWPVWYEFGTWLVYGLGIPNWEQHVFRNQIKITSYPAICLLCGIYICYKGINT